MSHIISPSPASTSSNKLLAFLSNDRPSRNSRKKDSHNVIHTSPIDHIATELQDYNHHLYSRQSKGPFISFHQDWRGSIPYDQNHQV